MSPATRLRIAAAWPVLTFLTAALLPRLAQHPAYHDYADQRTLLGLPHFWNVASNGAIAAAGLLGLAVLWRGRPTFIHGAERWLFGALFATVLWTAAGSAYYHGDPTTFTLYWDRLPIALALGLLLVIAIAERLGSRAALGAALPILLAGFASVTGWIAGEAAGRGDLTFYFAFQATCLGGLPLLWVLYPLPYTGLRYYVLALGIYGVALGFEQTDRAVYAVLGMGGHAIKHLLVGVAIAVLAAMLVRRAPTPQGGG